MTRSRMRYKTYCFTHIVNKRLKYSRIVVDEYGDIVVKTPYGSRKHLENFLASQEEWLKRVMQKEFRERPKTLQEVELFGKVLPVDSVLPLKRKLEKIRSQTPQNIQRAYDLFYKETAQEHILPRVEHFARKMRLYPKEIRFRKMKRRWGSCSRDSILTFNTNLLKRPKEFIDEVVVHELAHLVHFDHSEAFYTLLKQHLQS